MVKKSPTKRTVATSRHRATTTKKPVRTHRYDEASPKYRHYSAYQPKKPVKKPTITPDLTIRHRSTTSTPVKRRPHSETLRLRRIIITIIVCLLVILGALAAKIWVGDAPTTSQPQTTEVKPAKPTEKPAKSDIELKKEKAEQDLEIIKGVLNESTFSTNNVMKLKVPIYTQVYRQSCEAASLRMALAYRGIETTDLAVLELMNYDNQPAKKVDDRWTWGDPYETYVGDKDGDQTKMTGYGVFGEPIAASSEKLGRPAVVQNEVTPEWLAQQIYAGNPVILWGASIKIADAKWTTTTGREITAPMRTHTRLVVGVRGDPNKPTGFYINDPAGKEIYYTTKQLVDNVAAGIGQAVAIY